MVSKSGSNDRALLTVTDGMAELRLTHPEKLNCFSLALAEDLRDLTLAVADRTDVRAVVVTAEGRSFSAGADLEILESDDPTALDRLQELYGVVFEWLHTGDVPVVAGARGPVIGAGASLLCYASDLRVVGTDVEIWWPEIEYGVAPLSRTVYLANEIGTARALELMLLGEHGKLTAAESHTLGLVNRVVPPKEVDDVAREMATIIASYDREHDIASDFLECVYHARRESVGASLAYAAQKRRERERARHDV